MVLLSGVERCLLRINDPKRLEEFLNKLVSRHVNHFGVSNEMLVSGLEIVAGIFLDRLGKSHMPKQDNVLTYDEEPAKHIWQNCEICSTWARFFELLRKSLEETKASVANGKT